MSASRDEGGEDVGGAEVMSASNICDRGGSDIPVNTRFPHSIDRCDRPPSSRKC